MSSSSEIHVLGCNIWSDYSADVIFDDGTAMVFGSGLDAFARIRRVDNGSGGGSSASSLNFNQHNRLAIDIQQHYTGHALSRDVAHVGAALKVISTLAPRPKFLRVAVKAVDGDDGIVHWTSASASMEDFVAPPLNGGADTINNIRVGADGSVTVVALGGNASLWLSANGAFFDVTWPARAYESDGRSIQFVSSSSSGEGSGSSSSSVPGMHNTVKSILCVPLQQRFPVGLAIDAARRCSPPPPYRSEAIDSHLAASSFWAPLACWAPLLRVAIQTWKDRCGGVCPESVTQFLATYSVEIKKPRHFVASTNNNTANNNNNNSSSTDTSTASQTATFLVPNFDAVSSNFPPPIPPKVNPVLSPFPRVSFEDAATLLASTAERLHSLPGVHDRVHTAAALCVAWCAGDRACWLSPEPGIARSLVLEDMSCLHVEGLVPGAPIALLHIQNAVQRQELSPPELEEQRQASGGGGQIGKMRLVAAAKVYSWESGSRIAAARHAPLLPSCIVLPRDFTPCSVPDGVNIFLSRHASVIGGSSSSFSMMSSTSVADSAEMIAAAAQHDPHGDPRRGRYLHAEVEFMASLLEIGRSSAARAAMHAPARSPALGLIAANSNGPNSGNSGGVTTATMKQHYAHLNSSSSIGAGGVGGAAVCAPLPGENVGAVKCSSVIPNVGTFTAYQDGSVRCHFDDRTILSMRHEGIEPAAAANGAFPQQYASVENIFVTALDHRAIATRFRAASCTPQHPMYIYLQYAMPFLRYSLLPAEERAQLSGGDVGSLTHCRSDFDNATRLRGEEEMMATNPARLASQLERVVARSNLALQRHQEMSSQRRDLLSKCEFAP